MTLNEIMKAVREKADQCGADPVDAQLFCAKLRDMNLYDANLAYANLNGHGLRNAFMLLTERPNTRG